MNNNISTSFIGENGLVARTLRHDSFKKGTSALLASLLFAIASELIFPSNRS